MRAKEIARINKIKREYGADAFVRFGKMGGSPLLSPEKVREYNRSKKLHKK
jgi:hypothetical protein